MKLRRGRRRKGREGKEEEEGKEGRKCDAQRCRVASHLTARLKRLRPGSNAHQVILCSVDPLEFAAAYSVRTTRSIAVKSLLPFSDSKHPLVGGWASDVRLRSFMKACWKVVRPIPPAIPAAPSNFLRGFDKIGKIVYENWSSCLVSFKVLLKTKNRPVTRRHGSYILVIVSLLFLSAFSRIF
ncbi:hypothetical protein GYMLUDRAFT_637804 [Collybiopsis luxurians FD-317 M1]|nr:hypothetical protein GYMLUDRAFT_637804 [Collybiopsis luxurians FD-317 M1]